MSFSLANASASVFMSETIVRIWFFIISSSIFCTLAGITTVNSIVVFSSISEVRISVLSGIINKLTGSGVFVNVGANVGVTVGV